MNRKIKGIGFVKRGVYKTLDVAGVGIALGDIDVKNVYVKGTFKGKKVQNIEEIVVEGFVRGRINVCNYADILTIGGRARMQKMKENSIVFKGEGTLVADTIAIDYFHLIGNCRMNMLKAAEAHVVETNDNKYAIKQMSVIDEMACRKLVAYHLKAKKVTAQEVELYGNCEIDTLICETIRHCDSECVVKKHIKKNMFDPPEERDE